MVFSTEAGFSLIAMAIVLAGIQAVEKESLSELLVMQKEHDLIKVWAKQEIPKEEDMEMDFIAAFPGSSGAIAVNGKKTLIGEQKGKAITTSAKWLEKNLEETEISLTVLH